MRSDRPTDPAAGRRAGFTLVELLVVIGIIALLIGILLPSLAKARSAAKQTACASKLHQIMLAAVMSRNDHHDYYPLVGVLPSGVPTDLDDAYAEKYAYLSRAATVSTINGFQPRKVAAITEALSVYMGFRNQILLATNGPAVSNLFDPSNYIRNFLCPAQADSLGEMSNIPAGSSMLLTGTANDQTESEPQSYVYNEVIMGWYDPFGRLRGRANQIRRPTETMFAADGLHSSVGAEAAGFAYYTLFNKSSKVPVTVGDAFLGNSLAGDPASFDLRRHNKKINVAFCDGHVDSRFITAKDLATVFLRSN